MDASETACVHAWFRKAELNTMLTYPQSDTLRKINDSDLLSSIISESEFWHIPSSWARFLHSWLFLLFLAYFKMKEKEDKKGGKVLQNEQGLRCHKLDARQDSELGLSVA